MPQVSPEHAPFPRAALGTDLTSYFVLRVDATGRVQVRGEDQLFSMHSVVATPTSGLISGADGFISSPPVLAGYYWIITSVVAWDATSACTRIRIMNRHNGANVEIHTEERAFAIAERVNWTGHTYMDVDDVIRVSFAGGLAGDTVNVNITGYRMTVE